MSGVLILGGYGGFGGRLSRRLARAGVAVIVAGRSRAAAERFCADQPGCRPLLADRRTDLSPILAAERPVLVIDAAGPFQHSGYAVPRACAAAGIPYLDLADDRAFVAGIGEVAADVPVIAGASSVPALSGAVVRHLTRDMTHVAAIEMAISASNRAAAGASVAAAILSGVGRPLPLWRGGRFETRRGWQGLRRQRFDLSDGNGLGSRLVALADVPDIVLLPDRVAGRPAVTFRAGTELAFQNLALWLASWPVRWFGGSLRPFARWLLPLQRLTAGLGSDRSGMIVRVFGTVGDRRVERRWTLVAGDGDGPEIPVLAAELLTHRILRGALAPGARDAGQALSLADFEPLFARLAIRHETREHPQTAALYRRVMGDAFDTLPPLVRAVHGTLRDGGAHGHATVVRGTNRLARAVATVIRFPPSGEHALHVHFAERGGVETWTRDFSGCRFRSRMLGRADMLFERFGPLRFTFALVPEPNGLRMVMRGWSCLGVPLPLALAPRSDAREWQDEGGRFAFDVPIALPLIGAIVHYRGWLVPENANGTLRRA